MLFVDPLNTRFVVYFLMSPDVLYASLMGLFWCPLLSFTDTLLQGEGVIQACRRSNYVSSKLFLYNRLRIP